MISKNPQVVYRELSDAEGGLLLHMETGQYHGLNKVGALIWSLIDGASTVSDILTRLRERLNDAPVQLEEDLTRFLRDLQERNLIHIEEEDTPR
ncbi:MAG TPA: PqqD family protein [bacterium]|jgi:hypothetical protein|nr:PqqD family protein [bacterium]